LFCLKFDFSITEVKKLNPITTIIELRGSMMYSDNKANPNAGKITYWQITIEAFIKDFSALYVIFLYTKYANKVNVAPLIKSK
jgi:hypothetical protein